MKKLLLILLITIPCIGFGQEIVTNKNGERIILNKDKTWDYLSITKSTNDSANYNSCFGVLSKYPGKFSTGNGGGVIKSFDLSNYEVLDYTGTPVFNKDGSVYFVEDWLVRDVNGKTGFVSQYQLEWGNDEDKNRKLREFNYGELIKKLDQKNSIEILEKETPLNIIGTRLDEINSVGGVSFYIYWQYLDNLKEIKYIHFTVVPYNSVGDQVGGKYNPSGKFTGKVTGPISAGNRISHYWKNAWYNNTVAYIKIIKVKVEYMDGSKYTYVKELPKISSPFLKYYSF